MPYQPQVVISGSKSLVWGSGFDGNPASSNPPTELPPINGKKIVKAAGRGTVVAFITEGGELYEIAREDQERGEIDADGGSTYFLNRLPDQQVVGVAVGRSHLAAITAEGRVYTWGSGEDGQLGHGGIKSRHEPTLIMSLAGHNVIAVSCGFRHTAVLTAKGSVYTFGNSAWGQLGHGTTKPVLSPRCVHALERRGVVALACGPAHTVALTENGDVFTWGDNECGQLGHGHCRSLLIPEHVTSIAGKCVRRIAAGFGHTLCATGYELYSFGLNNHGQLGLGHTRPVLQPALVETLTNKMITDVCAGDFFSIALVGTGECWSWGCAQYRALGHSKASSTFGLSSLTAGRDGNTDSLGSLHKRNKLSYAEPYPRVIAQLLSYSVVGLSCGAKFALAVGLDK